MLYLETTYFNTRNTRRREVLRTAVDGVAMLLGLGLIVGMYIIISA